MGVVLKMVFIEKATGQIPKNLYSFSSLKALKACCFGFPHIFENPRKSITFHFEICIPFAANLEDQWSMVMLPRKKKIRAR